jgi:hypothetical protein
MRGNRRFELFVLAKRVWRESEYRWQDDSLDAHPFEILGVTQPGFSGIAVATTRFVASFLYGVKSNDPMTLIFAAGTLALVGAFTGYLPARRASRLDPITALRDE